MSRVNNNHADSAKKFIPGLGTNIFIQPDEIEADLVDIKEFQRLARKVNESIDTVDKLAVPRGEYIELLDTVAEMQRDVESMVIIMGAMYKITPLL